jgi:hypothetical protein
MATDPVQHSDQPVPVRMSAFLRHISIMHLLSLGYEPHNMRLFRLGQSLVTALASADVRREAVSGLLRLPHLSLSRHVLCTDPCTNRVPELRASTVQSSRLAPTTSAQTASRGRACTVDAQEDPADCLVPSAPWPTAPASPRTPPASEPLTSRQAARQDSHHCTGSNTTSTPHCQHVLATTR